MDKRQRKARSLQFVRTVVRMEKQFEPLIDAAIRSQLAPVLALLRAQGPEALKFYMQSWQPNNALNKPLADLYKTFALYQARRTTAEIGRSETKAGFGFDIEFLAAIIEYFQRNILIKVMLQISETTKALILAALIKGEQEGWGLEQIVKEIGDPEISKARARLIVRTEAVIAMNYGRKVATRKSRFETESVWIAAHDKRTRHSHLDIDGTRIPEGQRFPVPIYKGDAIVGYDFMTGPGDPTASAGNVCNCRCTMVTTAKRDAQGKLIPKQNISVLS